MSTVKLYVSGELCGEVEWLAAIKIIERQLLFRRLKELPHGQREVAYVAVAVYAVCTKGEKL